MPIPPNTTAAGFSYLVQGAGWLIKPGMKRFVLVPLLANLLIFILLTFLLIQYFSSIYTWFESWLNFWDWLSFIASFIAAFLSVLIFFLILLIYGFSFNVITNLIGAPFYGLLTEKIDHRISNTTPPEESTPAMVARTLHREIIKLWYITSRSLIVSLGLLLLSFIPFVNLLVPVLAVIWSSWVMTLQYVDYPADSYQLSFTQLRQRLKPQFWSTLGFGGSVALGSMVPVFNILIVPIAVAGGTVFWNRELRAVSVQIK
ncbi:MAG: CysZ protein [Cellvibrionaceae bacterium]|jgi:CysZ protein